MPIHLEKYWVRYHAQHRVAVPQLVQVRLEAAALSREVLTALKDTELVILPPSNPVVSGGHNWAAPASTRRSVALQRRSLMWSPIIASAVRGMTDACLRLVGDETSAETNALHGNSRLNGALDDSLHETDAAALPSLTTARIPQAAVPL